MSKQQNLGVEKVDTMIGTAQYYYLAYLKQEESLWPVGMIENQRQKQ